MPLVQRVCRGLTSRITLRFSTKASRFGLAVSAGFVVAFVGLASVGFDRSGSAEGLADLFGSGFSGQSLFGAPQPQAQPQYAVEGGHAAFWHHRSAHRHGDTARNDKHDAHLQKAKAGDGGGFEPIGRRSICVRLCDGYAFPVGDYHGDGDRASHEATCHAECPGAATALYVMPAGSDSIADAIRVGSNKSYSKLPDAFHYTNVLDGACRCHPTAGNSMKSLLRDFTLRRGDAVMTQTGFKVFHGASQFPYKRRDFVELSRSRDIRGPNRAAFKEIERASLMVPSVVAQAPQAPAVKPVADRNGTRTLEHQASR